MTKVENINKQIRLLKDFGYLGNAFTTVDQIEEVSYQLSLLMHQGTQRCKSQQEPECLLPPTNIPIENVGTPLKVQFQYKWHNERKLLIPANVITQVGTRQFTWTINNPSALPPVQMVRRKTQAEQDLLIESIVSAKMDLLKSVGLDDQSIKSNTNVSHRYVLKKHVSTLFDQNSTPEKADTFEVNITGHCGHNQLPVYFDFCYEKKPHVDDVQLMEIRASNGSLTLTQKKESFDQLWTLNTIRDRLYSDALSTILENRRNSAEVEFFSQCNNVVKLLDLQGHNDTVMDTGVPRIPLSTLVKNALMEVFENDSNSPEQTVMINAEYKNQTGPRLMVEYNFTVNKILNTINIKSVKAQINNCTLITKPVAGRIMESPELLYYKVEQQRIHQIASKILTHAAANRTQKIK